MGRAPDDQGRGADRFTARGQPARGRPGARDPAPWCPDHRAPGPDGRGDHLPAGARALLVRRAAPVRRGHHQDDPDHGQPPARLQRRPDAHRGDTQPVPVGDQRGAPAGPGQDRRRDNAARRPPRPGDRRRGSGRCRAHRRRRHGMQRRLPVPRRDQPARGAHRRAADLRGRDPGRGRGGGAPEPPGGRRAAPAHRPPDDRPDPAGAGPRRRAGRRRRDVAAADLAERVHLREPPARQRAGAGPGADRLGQPRPVRLPAAAVRGAGRLLPAVRARRRRPPGAAGQAAAPARHAQPGPAGSPGGCWTSPSATATGPGSPRSGWCCC